MKVVHSRITPYLRGTALNKISAIWNLFRQGQCVADPAKWKGRQITATVLGVFLLGIVNLLAAFGYSIPIDVETANAIAAGIIAVVNTVLTITTTEKVGIKVTKEVIAKVPEDASSDNMFTSDTFNK